MGLAATLGGAYLALVNIAVPFFVNVVVWSTAGLVALTLMDSNTGRNVSRSQIMPRSDAGASIRPGSGLRTATSDGLRAPDSCQRCCGTDGDRSGSTTSVAAAGGIGAVGWVSVAIILAQIGGLEVAARISEERRHRAAIVAAGSGIASACVVAAGLANAHMGFALVDHDGYFYDGNRRS